MHFICDIGNIFIAGANFIKFAYVVINNVYYDISRTIMFITRIHKSLLFVIMYCYICIRLNLISKLIIIILIASVCQP